MFAYSRNIREGEAKTFSLQNSLPKLPVPPLEQTLSTYLYTLRPQLLQEAADKGLAEAEHEAYVKEELSKREAWAKDFSAGLGKTLQERLIDVDHFAPNNWLDDTWWLEMAYHTWRVPLAINSNWWVLFRDDGFIPESLRQSIPPKGTFTPWQVKRAALIAQRAAEFNLRLNAEAVPVDRSKAGPFCMHQMKLMYSQTRVPGLPRDNLPVVPFPNPYRTALVYANDHPYTIEVIEADGNVASLKDIEKRLWAVAQDAQQRGPNPVPVSVLTADDRDSWAVAREHLLELDPKTNRDTLTKIEQSLFGLSLDAWTVAPEGPYRNSAVKGQSPDNDSHILAAKAGGGEGRNRWWDKSLTFSVESNGRGSLLGEHSPCDALIPSLVAEYVVAIGLDDPSVQKAGYEASEAALSEARGSVALETHGVEYLPFVTDAQTESAIQHALATVKDLAADSDAQQHWYDEYGTDFIKKVAAQPPDAYCQMALQLAYYLTHGRSVSTYETASTRAFRHGRTDVIRSFSEPALLMSRAFAKAADKGIDALSEDEVKHLYELLSTATKAHSGYTRNASFGKGIDRHLLGLRLTMRGDESHPLFQDPLFAKSQTWTLSTSGLSAAPYFNGTGFGAPQDGYGINYLAAPTLIKFGIDSKRSASTSDIAAFRANITKAMRLLAHVAQRVKAIEPKL